MRDAISGKHESSRLVLNKLRENDYSKELRPVYETAVLYEQAALVAEDQIGQAKDLLRGLCAAKEDLESCSKKIIENYKQDALITIDRFNLESYYLFSKTQYSLFNDAYFLGNELHALGYMNFPIAVKKKKNYEEKHLLNMDASKEYCSMVDEVKLIKNLYSKNSELVDSEANACIGEKRGQVHF